MTFLHAVLLLSALLCSLVTGLLLTFAIVVMPGIGKLDDRSFIRAFQVIDGVIQNNHPVFLFVWMGSILALVAAAILSVWDLSGVDRTLTISAALSYFLGVQAPTAAINLPLNNSLQKLDPDAMNEAARKQARTAFESRWNRWNAIRTACATFVSLLLLVLLLRV